MRPLPDPMPASSISVADARARGITPAQLRRMPAPFPGIRATDAAEDPRDLRVLCRQYRARLKDGQFFSHSTALALHGIPVPSSALIHVAQHRPAREPRVRGVVGHRLQVREAAWSLDADGLPIEHPVRAWRQCAWLWDVDELIVAADAIVLPRRGLATIDELRDEARAMGDHDGRLRRALPHVRYGSESGRETRLRLAITRAGLPEPVLGYELFTARGGFVARFDEAYPEYRVAVEYDGRQHAFDVAQFEHDADRWAAIAGEGWTLVRILNHHMRREGAIAVRKVALALRDAGWSAGQRIG